MPTDPEALESPPPDVYTLTVDGDVHTVDPVWVGDSLLTVMRDQLGLTATKNACDQGECGSCTVLLDGLPVVSCCVMAADAVGAAITTVAGMEGPDGGLTDVQQAFIDAGAVQCGFCTPGLIVAAQHLLDVHPDADDLQIREALSGNLCRCTGYGRILHAVQTVRDTRSARSRSEAP